MKRVSYTVRNAFPNAFRNAYRRALTGDGTTDPSFLPTGTSYVAGRKD